MTPNTGAAQEAAPPLPGAAAHWRRALGLASRGNVCDARMCARFAGMAAHAAGVRRDQWANAAAATAGNILSDAVMRSLAEAWRDGWDAASHGERQSAAC